MARTTAARKQGKPFLVSTEPSKEVVVDGLTRDVDVPTCVFDLIDNSADAARDTIFANVAPADRRVLPETYESFEINLNFNADGLTIKDNCGGIPVESLRNMVLRFGKRSMHDMGIGVFGVGLNRALFKLGRVSHLKTDTGAQRAELVLDTAEYRKTEKWDLPAQDRRRDPLARLRRIADNLHPISSRGRIGLGSRERPQATRHRGRHAGLIRSAHGLSGEGVKYVSPLF